MKDSLEVLVMKTVETQSFQERRKHTRYNATDGAFAAVSPNSFKLGQIVNISRGGLAFQYIDTTRNVPGKKEETHIFLSSKGYYVRGLPFKTVSDYEVPNDNPFSTLKMRQRAIQFCEMSFEQKTKLDHYIMNNADQYESH